MGRAACLLFLAATVPLGAARADEPSFTLRLATAAPDGTPWAREAKGFARDVERRTGGALRIKLYLGGIAGDDLQVLERIRSGLLDGAASGGPMCERIVPSTRVLGIPGLFQDRDEVALVMNLLRPALEEEAQHEGFNWLGAATMGPAVIFSRKPIRTWAELLATRLWDWDLFDFEIGAEKLMGLKVVSSPLLAAKRAYDSEQVDGFIAIPVAALAFQWSTQARYIMDLRTRYLIACLVIANRAFDRLPIEYRQEVLAAGAKLGARLEDLGRKQDDQLLNGLFARQGLTPVPVSERLRSEFFEATRAVRERIRDQPVPPQLLSRVLQIISDYRAEHGKR